MGPYGPMLRKTQNICKKNSTLFFQKIKKSQSVWLRGSNIENWKEIRALGSDIIATWTDGRTTGGRMDDGRRTNFDFMRSADIVKQS